MIVVRPRSASEQLHDLLALAGVQAARRLVRQITLGLEMTAGDRDELLPAGELIR
jgi:hypothetical protein